MKFVIELNINPDDTTLAFLFDQTMDLMKAFVAQGVPPNALPGKLLEKYGLEHDEVILGEVLPEHADPIATPDMPVIGRMSVVRAEFDSVNRAIRQAKMTETSEVAVYNSRDGSREDIKV